MRKVARSSCAAHIWGARRSVNHAIDVLHLAPPGPSVHSDSSATASTVVARTRQACPTVVTRAWCGVGNSPSLASVANTACLAQSLVKGGPVTTARDFTEDAMASVVRRGRSHNSGLRVCIRECSSHLTSESVNCRRALRAPTRVRWNRPRQVLSYRRSSDSELKSPTFPQLPSSDLVKQILGTTTTLAALREPSPTKFPGKPISMTLRALCSACHVAPASATSAHGPPGTRR